MTVILTDVEGTTSPIAFVREVLFPYAHARLADWVAAHREEARVQEVLRAAAAAGGDADADEDTVVAWLRAWIDADRKVTALKTLQGWIWRDGFEAGAFQAPVYDDAADGLRGWKAGGHRLAVYSSGSVGAQRLFYGHSTHGDLRPLFEAHFDTAIGSKKEAASYRRIAEALGVEPGEVLFLTDAEAEVDAARAAGCRVVWVVRPEDRPDADLADPTVPVVSTFADIVP